MGWDDDKTGDYVPKAMPKAVWLVIAFIGGIILMLAVFLN